MSITEKMKKLAHDIHAVSIKIDQDVHLGKDVDLEDYENLQVIAHELADEVIHAPKKGA